MFFKEVFEAGIGNVYAASLLLTLPFGQGNQSMSWSAFSESLVTKLSNTNQQAISTVLETNYSY